MNIVTNKHSIIYKILLIVLISIFIPTVIMCNIYYRNVDTSYEKNVITSFDIILNQYINNVDNSLEIYKEMMENLITQNEIIMMTEDNPVEAGIYDLSSKFMPNMASKGEIFRCTLYTKKSFSGWDYTFENAQNEKWFPEYVNKKNFRKWFYNNTPGREIPLISIIYPIRKSGNYIDLNGVLKLDLYLEKVLGDPFPGEWDESVADCVICSENKEILWSMGNNLESVLKFISEKENMEITSDMDKMTRSDEEIIRYKKIGNQNIYIICKMYRNYINNAAAGEKNFFYLQILIMLIILIITVGFFMISLSKKITTIGNKIKKIESLDFSPASNVGGNDEFALIDTMIDRMQIRLNEQIEKNYMLQIKLREAEINALCFQINPHFLYNALESISEIAYIEGSEKAASMSRKLGHMFRYSISLTMSGGETELKDEIEYIKSYLEIQNIRFDDKFRLTLEIPDEVKSEKILKFSLQPIIENAVKYAFAKRTSGNIEVIAYKKENDLYVEVSDDGIGILPERLKMIKNNMDGEGNGMGIGLSNVNKRLILEYGSEYELKIKSEYGKGTKIILRFYVGEKA